MEHFPVANGNPGMPSLMVFIAIQSAKIAQVAIGKHLYFVYKAYACAFSGKGFLRLFGLVFIAFLGKSVFTELLFFVLTMLRFSLKRHNKSVPGNEIIALAQPDNDTTSLRPRGSFGTRVPR